MREALTDALATFEGTVILVSHDRHLLRHADRSLFGWHSGASRWQYGSGDIPGPLTTKQFLGFVSHSNRLSPNTQR